MFDLFLSIFLPFYFSTPRIFFSEIKINRIPIKFTIKPNGINTTAPDAHLIPPAIWPWMETIRASNVKITPVIANPTPNAILYPVEILLFFLQNFITKNSIALGNTIRSKGKIKIIIGSYFR